MTTQEKKAAWLETATAVVQGYLANANVKLGDTVGPEEYFRFLLNRTTTIVLEEMGKYEDHLRRESHAGE